MHYNNNKPFVFPLNKASLNVFGKINASEILSSDKLWEHSPKLLVPFFCAKSFFFPRFSYNRKYNNYFTFFNNEL